MRKNMCLCKMRYGEEMCMGGCSIVSGSHMHKFNIPTSSAAMRQSLVITENKQTNL